MRWIARGDLGHWIGKDEDGNIVLAAMNTDGTRDSVIYEPDWERISEKDAKEIRFTAKDITLLEMQGD